MQSKKHMLTIWLMWSLASFFYAYQYVLRVLPNIMMSDILEKFHIDATIFGQFSGFYYIGYAGMHIPVGLMLDKYGPKWVLPLCILLTAVGLLPLLYADHWAYPAIGRILIGMGSSAAILGVFKIIRMSFEENKFTVILGCSVTIGLIGAIYGGQPVNYLINNLGSDAVLKMIIIVGLVLAVATFLVIPAHGARVSNQGWFQSVKTVLTNKRILLVCFFAGLMVGPLEGFADVWGKEYLKTVYHLDESMASSLPSLIFLGMCFGSPLLSWVTARTQAYYGFIIASGLVMGGAFAFLLTGHVPVSILAVLFVLVGVFCAYQILAIYKASTYSGEELVGLTTACANMIIMIFGYFFHSLIGNIMTQLGGGRLVDNMPYYDPNAYTYALCVIPIGLALGALGFIWLSTSSKPNLDSKSSIVLGRNA